MTVRYIIGRLAAQFGVLALAVLYIPWLEQAGRLADQANLNAFMYTFLAASLPPIWRRGVALKARVAAIGIGMAVALAVGLTYLPGSNGAFLASSDIVPFAQLCWRLLSALRVAGLLPEAPSVGSRNVLAPL
jgi:hypothetical protein